MEHVSRELKTNYCRVTLDSNVLYNLQIHTVHTGKRQGINKTFAVRYEFTLA